MASSFVISQTKNWVIKGSRADWDWTAAVFEGWSASRNISHSLHPTRSLRESTVRQPDIAIESPLAADRAFWVMISVRWPAASRPEPPESARRWPCER
jgi:hypothetical protein